MGTINTHNNFYAFTASLVFLLIASAVLSSADDKTTQHVLQGVIVLTELVAYFSLNLSRQWRLFIGVSLVLVILNNVLREYVGWHIAPLTSLILTLIFYCGMAYVAARQVFSSGGIEFNQVVGTVALYLLLGLIWALLYLVALEFWPAGIRGIEHRNWNSNLGEMAYFSFITMASVGYGDITPTVPVTRTLAYLQGIAGLFYMAVVVAGMMGAFQRKSTRKH